VRFTTPNWPQLRVTILLSLIVVDDFGMELALVKIDCVLRKITNSQKIAETLKGNAMIVFALRMEKEFHKI
jgi:hypothetical protein